MQDSIFHALGNNKTDWPDIDRMYFSRDWQKILMLQTFADRFEWNGPYYHFVNPKRSLVRVLKVFGGFKNPIREPQASKFISNTIENIIELDPDVVGLGGMDETAKKIKTGLKDANFQGQIDYWGGEVGMDACKFLKTKNVCLTDDDFIHLGSGRNQTNY
jgi:hypothetical protein